MKKHFLLLIPALLILSGCWTIHSDVKGKSLAAQNTTTIGVVIIRPNDPLVVFQPTVSPTQPTTGTYIDGQYVPAKNTTAITNEVTPFQMPDDAYRFIRDTLEYKGFNTQTPAPQYVLRYNCTADLDWGFFSVTKTVLVDLCTLLFCVREQHKINTEISIYDTNTGRELKRIEKQTTTFFAAISPFWCYGHIFNDGTYPENTFPLSIRKGLDEALPEAINFMVEHNKTSPITPVPVVPPNTPAQ